MADWKCAECIHNSKTMGSQKIQPAEAIVDGTALCVSHAENAMEKVAEARRQDPTRFLEMIRELEQRGIVGD